MRIRGFLITLAAALLPAGAGAQTATAPATPAASAPATAAATATAAPAPWSGSFDLGVRNTSTSGDAARYERYRDLGSGLFLEDARLSREQGNWLLDLGAEHAGRRDQRYTGSVERPGKLKAAFMWDQIPMLLSNSTRTLFTGIGTGVLSVDDALQAQVQAVPSRLAAIFQQNATTFETRTARKIGEGAFEYLANRALTLSGHVRRTNRSGTIPFGGSFGHSSLVELPAPTDHDLTEVDAGAEYLRGPMLLRAGYTGSWFHNNVTSIAFDNPFLATDGLTSSSRGRIALAPSNSFIGVNGFASVKLPRRSRLSAYVSTGTLKDAGDPILPQTINSAIVTMPLARSTVDGEARTSSVNLTFVSRPSRVLDVNVRYRIYDYDNRTPEFLMSQRVAYDNAPSLVNPPIPTEAYGVIRHTLDADVRLIPVGGLTAGVGFTRIDEERTHRIYESTTDDVVRLTVDRVSTDWFTLRTKYEHGQRRGKGIEEGERELAAIGEQPGMRHFDIAPRNRDRVTILGAITPVADMAITASVAAGKDDYLQSLFGLRDNTHRVYTSGLDLTPTEHIILSTSYSFERYNALSRSRQANPGVQFTDPSRNWATDATDRVHSVVASAEVNRIAEKLNLRFGYDFSKARALYQYTTGAVVDRTLPEEVVVPTTLPTPTGLPPTLSQLGRGTMDATYAVTSRVSLGVSWWHEEYRVQDFTLDADANPDLARGQALLMGYLYRPYTANTVWGRLIYAW